MEQARGISVTTSVMQFPYRDRVVNLLDTPGHEDFSEDTYRTLTAVDAALMVIDGAKGVEPRTKKLLEVCRLRDTPILTFINKLDRDIRDPIELLDEVEAALDIACAPITWPIGRRAGLSRRVSPGGRPGCTASSAGMATNAHDHRTIDGLDSAAARAWLGDDGAAFQEEVALVRGASHPYDRNAFLSGRLTPVFFGTALGNFGVDHFLNHLVEEAPCPKASKATTRTRRRHRGAVHRLRVQDSSEHGSQAPRPHRLPARLLRPLPRRNASAPCAHRGGHQGVGRQDLLRRRTRPRRGRLRRRHHRPAQPRRHPDW